MLLSHIIQIYNEITVNLAGAEIAIFFVVLISWICIRYIIDNSLIIDKRLKIIFPGLLLLTICTIWYKYPVLKSFSTHHFKHFLYEIKDGLVLNRGFLLGFVTLSYILFFESLRKTRKEKEELIRKNLVSQLNFLRQQINPHFLFNSLNVLKSGAKEDWVIDYVVELSKVYRYLLNYNNGADLTLINHELDFLQAYIHILKERFEDGLIVNIAVSTLAKTKTIPVLSLQILVENAVKHNVVSLSRPLHISIYNEENYLVVTNNRQMKRKGYNRLDTKSGLGLNNLEERYHLIANDSICIEDEQNNFTVKIPML